MGLQSQLSDVSSENILVLVTVLVARSARYLRHLLFAILHGLGLVCISSQAHVDLINHRRDDSFLDDIFGSGLSGVILLCEQLSLNRVSSNHDRLECDECVVCLSRMEQGDRVRQLPCLHVFHSDCLDEWLYRLNFNCPLCRAPSYVSAASGQDKRRRVAMDLLAWFDSMY